jgi:hypothetical protein
MGDATRNNPKECALSSIGGFDAIELVKVAACLRRMLVLPALALAAASCRESSGPHADARWWGLENDRLELAHQVELLQFRLSKMEMSDAEFRRVRDDAARSASRRAELAEQVRRLRQELEEARTGVATARAEWIQGARAAVVGRRFETLDGARGRSYRDVVITRVTDAGVEFRHATGTARLTADELSPLRQDLFGLDPVDSGRAIEEEQRVARAYGAWVDGKVALAREQALEEARMQAAMEAETAARLRTVAVSQVAATPRTRLRDQPRSVGGTVWYPYFRNRYYDSYRSNCTPVSHRSICRAAIRFGGGTWSLSPSRSCHSPVIRPRVSFSNFTFSHR